MKNIGMWSKENTLDALEALAMAPITRVLGWTTEEVQMLLQGARTDIENEGIHAYWILWVLDCAQLSFCAMIITLNSRVVYDKRPDLDNV